MNPLEASPVLTSEWIRVSKAIDATIDPQLAELVKIRTSQINGCANCINMNTIEARKGRETEQRLYLLAAWREAPCFSDRERTSLGRSAQPSVRRRRSAPARYSTNILATKNLTLLINVIAGFNRIAVGFGLFADPADIKLASGAVSERG